MVVDIATAGAAAPTFEGDTMPAEELANWVGDVEAFTSEYWHRKPGSSTRDRRRPAR